MFVLVYCLIVCLEVSKEECQKNKLWLVALGMEREPITSNSEQWTPDLVV